MVDIQLNKQADASSDSSVIHLTRSNGEQVALTSQILVQWLAQIERAIQQNPASASDEYMATQFLGRFGLKSPVDVLTFLHSPAGETVRKMIEEHMAEMIAMQQYQYQQAMEQQAKEQQMLAFILLHFARKHDAKAHRLNELIQKQIDKVLSNKPSPDADKQGADPAKMIEALNTQIRHYGVVAQAIETVLNQKIAEQKALQQQLVVLQQQGQSINLKHQTLGKSLAKLAAFLGPNAQGITPVMTPQFLQAEILTLQNKIAALTVQISELVKDEHKGDIDRLMYKHHGLNLRLDGLKEVQAVINQEKKFYNLRGEKTNSFSDAAIVLRPEQRIVRTPDGQYFLVKINENLDHMDELRRKEAQLRLENLPPEILSVTHQAQYHFKMEMQAHLQQLDNARLRHSRLPQEIALLSQQLANVRREQERANAAKASLEAELKKQNPDARRVSNLQNSYAKVSTLSANASIPKAGTVRDALEKLLAGPATTANINNFSRAYGAVAGNTDAIKKAMGQIRAGDRIPPETMRFLQRTVNALHTPVTDRLDPKKASPDASPEEPAPTVSAPTPFDLRPSPFKTKG